MSEWISVEDKLPAGRNRWGSAWWMVNSPNRIPTTAIYDENSGNWYTPATGGGTHKLTVTHWRPLPAPPE